MTAMDIIDRVDMMEANDYSPEQKIRWLSGLDGKIFEEVLKTHEEPAIESWVPYETGQEELIVKEPYGDDIYYNYLQMKIAAENSETQRYNKRAQLFAAAYQEWTNWYNRHHKPKKTRMQFI